MCYNNPMKLIKRIIILLIAAALGTVVYGKYKAADNIAAESLSGEATADKKRTFIPPFGGGIGPVGNPNSQKPLGQPVKKPPY